MSTKDKNTLSSRVENRGTICRAAVILLFLVAAMAVCVWMGGGRGVSRWGGYTLGVLDDGRFLVFFSVAAVSMAVLFAAAIYILKRSNRRPDPGDGEGGNVLIEFAMLLPIILMFGLLMLQSSLLMGGYMTVHYASYCAARSAIVYIPEDFTRSPHNGEEGWNVVFLGGGPEGSDKLRLIKDAAVWAVMPVSASDYEGGSAQADFLESGLQDMFASYGKDEPNWVRNWLAPKFAYAEDNTWIELAPPTAGDGIVYGEHEDIHVMVRHNLYLSVPYAGRILAEMDPDAVELDDGSYAIKVEVPCTLTNEGSYDQIDIEEFPD